MPSLPSLPCVPLPAPGRGLARLGLVLLIGTVLLGAALVVAPGAQAAVAPGGASSRGPLLWTAPSGVDVRPIDAIACPSTSLCVAVDRNGNVDWSTDPAGGVRAWHRADVDGGGELTSVSCPSTRLCVAVDGAGNVVTSQDPTGGRGAWTVAKVDSSPTQNNTDNAGAVLVRGVSCPSTGLCVAVDAAGNALVSTDPTGGSPAWTITHIDTDSSYDCTGGGLTCQPPLVGISCSSTAQCAAIDFSGNLLTTADPTAPSPWTSTPTDGSAVSSLYGVSCPVVGFCATVDGSAGRAITVNPAVPAAQHARLLPDSLYGIWCESRSLCLASAETHGGISGLLGSFDPAAPAATWSLSSLGGVNAIACPSSSLCLAADDEGNVAAGATTRSITAALKARLLSTRHLPTIATLARTGRDKLSFTSLIAAQVKLVWTVAVAGGRRVTIASGSHRFATPGTGSLILRLNPAGRRVFNAAGVRLRLTGAATFSASTGSVTSTGRLTFGHPPK